MAGSTLRGPANCYRLEQSVILHGNHLTGAKTLKSSKSIGLLTALGRAARFAPLAAALVMTPAISEQPPERFTSQAGAEAGLRVAALGRIEPMDGIIRLGAPAPLASTTGLLIRELFVEEGDDVVVGQELAITDMADVLAAVAEEAQANVELARRQARAAASQARERCVLAEVREREAARREELLEPSVVTTEESDRARADASLATATCRSAQDQTAAMEAAIAVAEAVHRRAEAEYQRTRIVSPMDARVLEILARPGELVSMRGAFELARVDQMQAIAEVYEADLPRVAVGQRAEITSPVLGQTLTGQVRRIRQRVRQQDETASDPAARKDARIIEVEILLDQPEHVAGLTNLQVTVLISP